MLSFFFLTTPLWVQLVLIVYVGPSTRARTSYHSSCPKRRGTLRVNRSFSRVGPLNAASTHVEFWYIPVFPPPPGYFTAFFPSVPLLPSVAAVVTYQLPSGAFFYNTSCYRCSQVRSLIIDIDNCQFFSLATYLSQLIEAAIISSEVDAFAPLEKWCASLQLHNTFLEAGKYTARDIKRKCLQTSL